MDIGGLLVTHGTNQLQVSHILTGRSYICLSLLMVSWEEDKDEKIELKDMMLEGEKIKMNVNLPAGGGVVRGAGRRV